jgi:3',5'-cyclic AMP phosphodiesterase CpdA
MYNYKLFEMKKPWLILGILILIITGCNPKPGTSTSTEEDGFSFAFLTDIHLQPEKNAVEGFRQAIDTINKIHPDFVITGGDLVMDVLNQTYGRADSLYTLYREISGELTMPVYNTVGNHEVYGWHRDEEGIESHAEFGKQMFEKRIGDRYYSFDFKNWHFIILDAIYRSEEGHYIGRIDQEQIEWLKRDLEKTDKQTPIAITVHIPFITSRTQLSQGALAANTEGSVITNSREVLQLFAEHKLKLVLQGHLHYNEDLFVGNKVHFITAGAVSGRWWSNQPGDHPEEGFQMIHVKGETLSSEYIDFGWTPPGIYE